MCEGGKLVKKAKEEVPQPFVIGCGGDPCSCSSLLAQHSTTYSTHHSSTSIWGYSIPWPFMLPSPRTDPDKYIWTLCRMPLVWQSSLWWKCCQGGRASTKFFHWTINRTFTDGGSRPNAPVEGWPQWGGLGGRWSQTRDIGDLESHRRSNFVLFSLTNIGVSEKYTAALMWHLFTDGCTSIQIFMTSGITGSGRRPSHALFKSRRNEIFVPNIYCKNICDPCRVWLCNIASNIANNINPNWHN